MPCFCDTFFRQVRPENVTSVTLTGKYLEVLGRITTSQCRMILSFYMVVYIVMGVPLYRRMVDLLWKILSMDDNWGYLYYCWSFQNYPSQGSWSEEMLLVEGWLERGPQDICCLVRSTRYLCEISESRKFLYWPYCPPLPDSVSSNMNSSYFCSWYFYSGNLHIAVSAGPRQRVEPVQGASEVSNKLWGYP